MLKKLVRLVGPVKGFRLDDRRLLTLMYLAGVFQGYAQTQAVNTLPFARLTYELSQAQMSRLFAIARIGALIAVVWAAMGDRGGRRRPFLAAYLILFVATGATAFATTSNVYTALQLVARMGAATVGILATVLLAEQMRPENRAWAISLYAAAVSLGSGIGLMALPIARAGEESWRWLFGIALAGLVVYPLLRSKLRESRAFRFYDEKTSMLDPLIGAYGGGFWLLAAYSLCISAFSTVAVTFALERLVNDLGYSTSQAAAIMLVGGTVGGIGFFVGGRMADMYGRKATINIALLLGLLGGLGFYWLTAPVLLIPSVMLSALGSSAAIPASAAQRAEMFPTHIRATAVQWLHSVAVLGSMIGLFIGSVTIDSWGLPRTVATLGIGVILAIGIQAVIPETLGTQIGQETADA